LNLTKHIPNTLTCLNLISGMAGIYYVLDGHVLFGAYFILIAAFFDFFDGFAARMLKVSSDIGKELDSLADLVTFGVLPSFIIFRMMMDINSEGYLPFITFLIGVLSAVRLAKFNVDTRQTERFIGLPTPANALLLSTLPFLALHFNWVADLLLNIYFLAVLSVIMSLLLVAEIPYSPEIQEFWNERQYVQILGTAYSRCFYYLVGPGGYTFGNNFLHCPLGSRKCRPEKCRSVNSDIA